MAPPNPPSAGNTHLVLGFTVGHGGHQLVLRLHHVHHGGRDAVVRVAAGAAPTAHLHRRRAARAARAPPQAARQPAAAPQAGHLHGAVVLAHCLPPFRQQRQVPRLVLHHQHVHEVGDGGAGAEPRTEPVGGGGRRQAILDEHGLGLGAGHRRLPSVPPEALSRPRQDQPHHRGHEGGHDGVGPQRGRPWRDRRHGRIRRHGSVWAIMYILHAPPGRW